MMLDAAPPSLLAAAPVLGLGLVLGLKHALDADHLAAVSTIVSECKSVFSASMVGILWGVGHTASLLIAGVAVILLHLEIGARLALGLEFGVALMLIGLGANALRRIAHGTVHVHAHQHGGRVHFHPHVHDEAPDASVETHHRVGSRPLLVGMVHGLAGSAALMLLVLTTIPSPAVGVAYIAVFGLGSIGGMVVMSMLVSLPAQLAAARFSRADVATRALAGVFSLALGLSMAYDIGIVQGLLR